MCREILEVVTITCPCKRTTEYKNTMRGAINLGQCQKQTGWISIFNTYTFGSIWVCPDCYAQVLEHAQAIKTLLGTKNVSLHGIIGLEEE